MCRIGYDESVRPTFSRSGTQNSIIMFERFFQPDPEDSPSQESSSGDQPSTPFSVRRLRFESGHALPAPMFIRLKEDPPHGKE
jgi:hypothetical protein